ncbi:hypothetical protein [Schleiferilactobacillus harbinensis]|uniref:Uncharacterized protein n=1 Tax=Schleiferilactobacillus harbinensis TaxID=304207 RepID=A0ABU7T3U9_9LACO
MSNETKRDVFEVAMNHAAKSGWVDYSEMMSRYDAALPDDLPTLPRIIGEYLKDSKLAHNGISFLFQVGNHAMSDYRIAFENWAFTGKSFDEYEKGDTFSRAWVLGVWRVEETGEIVKLEAEK